MMKRAQINTSLAFKILEKLESSVQQDTVSMINLKDPDYYKKIMLFTEAELFKHKQKLHKNTQNNLGEGFSQFVDESTRTSILKQVQQILMMRRGLRGDSLLDAREKMLEILDKCIRHLKIDYKKDTEYDTQKPKSMFASKRDSHNVSFHGSSLRITP